MPVRAGGDYRINDFERKMYCLNTPGKCACISFSDEHYMRKLTFRETENSLYIARFYWILLLLYYQ